VGSVLCIRDIFMANRLARATTREGPEIFEDLRRRKRLAATVRHLNRMLDDPAHRDLAKSALKRIGLDHAG
jgi:hypothetical protein